MKLPDNLLEIFESKYGKSSLSIRFIYEEREEENGFWYKVIIRPVSIYDVVIQHQLKSKDEQENSFKADLERLRLDIKRILDVKYTV